MVRWDTPRIKNILIGVGNRGVYSIEVLRDSYIYATMCTSKGSIIRLPMADSFENTVNYITAYDNAY